jgi:hypothetical protein
VRTSSAGAARRESTCCGSGPGADVQLRWRLIETPGHIWARMHKSSCRCDTRCGPPVAAVVAFPIIIDSGTCSRVVTAIRHHWSRATYVTAVSKSRESGFVTLAPRTRRRQDPSSGGFKGWSQRLALEMVRPPLGSEVFGFVTVLPFEFATWTSLSVTNTGDSFGLSDQARSVDTSRFPHRVPVDLRRAHVSPGSHPAWFALPPRRSF